MKSLTVLATIAALIPAAAHAQQPYPNKPVRVIVTTVPGPLDAFARIVVGKMGERLKQNFVVENRPGAGGNIGAEVVSKAPADGYTLLFAIDTTFTVNPAMYRKLPFDPDKDFTTISVPVTYNQMLAVHPSVPVKSVQEFVALAKTRAMNYASGGNGSPSHLAMALFLSEAGLKMTHIPYKGTGQSVVDVVGGQVDSIFAVVTGVYPHVQSGRLRALGVSSPKRSLLAPDVPSVSERGYPKFDASFAYALMAPAGTPDAIVQTLSQELARALAQPDVQEKNRIADYAATGLDPKASAAWLVSTRGKLAKIIADANLRVD